MHILRLPMRRRSSKKGDVVITVAKKAGHWDNFEARSDSLNKNYHAVALLDGPRKGESHNFLKTNVQGEA